MCFPLSLIAQDRLPSVSYSRIDGGVPSDKRVHIAQCFNEDPRIKCVLLTTSVGGLGLNLTGADTVVPQPLPSELPLLFSDLDGARLEPDEGLFLCPPPPPCPVGIDLQDMQAMDRAHRIGAQRTVNVFRLISSGTLEEQIMGLQRFKLHIAASLVNEANDPWATRETSS